MTALGPDRVLAALAWVDFSDLNLPFFNEGTEGLLDTQISLAESQDGGETWVEPAHMDVAPLECPVPLTGPVLLLPGGGVGCQFELNKHYYDTEVWRHSSVLMFSRDAGRSWPEHVITSNDPENRMFYWDQRPGVLADGTVLEVFWTYDNQATVYRNIHARQSRDAGRTWSETWDMGVLGQPAQPVSLPDGGIAMAYVDRTGSPIIKVRTSRDGGHTWPDEGETVLHAGEVEAYTSKKGSMQDAWSEMGKFSVGLPATALIDGGDVLVAYYAGAETDRTDIRWVRAAQH